MSMVGMFSGVKAKYSIASLIGFLLQHKTKHEKEYADALEVYRDDLYDWIKKIRKDFRKVYNDVSKFEWDYPSNPPVNVSKSYDKLIANFNNMEGDEIELDMSQANAIVNNDWEWAISASTANFAYSSRKKK